MIVMLLYCICIFSLFPICQALLQADGGGCEQGHEHLLRERRVLQLPHHQVHGEPGGRHRQTRGQQAHRVGQGSGTLQHHPGTVRNVPVLRICSIVPNSFSIWYTIAYKTSLI